MRTRYSFYNFIVNLITSLVLPILGFIKLSLFLSLYGRGVNGFQVTISQIITFLNVCEIAYSLAFRQLLFKPLANDDKNTVLKIYSSARKVFKITGTIVLSASFVLAIMFPFFSKSPFDYFSTVLVFLILSFPYAISYFLMGPNLVIIADQKEYKINIWIQSIYIFRMIMMITAILLKQSFFVILLIEGLNILIANIIARKVALKNYPWLKEIKQYQNDKTFIDNAKYTIIQRLSTLATNNTDNILISLFLGYEMSGVFAVYSYLNEFIYKIVNSVISSTINSFGNLFNDRKANSYNVFKEFFEFASFIGSIVSICVFIVMDQFIPIILRRPELYGVPIYIILMFAINIFYLTIREPIIISRDASGLFRDAKNNAYLMAISKILLSIILIQFFNIAGVLLATLITNWTIDFLYNPKLVYTKVFNKNISSYYIMVFFRVLLAIIFGYIGYTIWISNISYISSSTINFLLSCIILGTVISTVLFIIYITLFKSFRNLIYRIFNLFLRKGVNR